MSAKLSLTLRRLLCPSVWGREKQTRQSPLWWPEKTVDNLHLGEEGPFEKKADVLTVPLSAHITLASQRLGEVGDIQTGKLSRNKT